MSIHTFLCIIYSNSVFLKLLFICFLTWFNSFNIFTLITLCFVTNVFSCRFIGFFLGDLNVIKRTRSQDLFALNWQLNKQQQKNHNNLSVIAISEFTSSSLSKVRGSYQSICRSLNWRMSFCTKIPIYPSPSITYSVFFFCISFHFRWFLYIFF